jgi:hypothetical protein
MVAILMEESPAFLEGIFLLRRWSRKEGLTQIFTDDTDQERATARTTAMRGMDAWLFLVILFLDAP